MSHSIGGKQIMCSTKTQNMSVGKDMSTER